jgi:hypothetical protein
VGLKWVLFGKIKYFKALVIHEMETSARLDQYACQDF